MKYDITKPAVLDEDIGAYTKSLARTKMMKSLVRMKYDEVTNVFVRLAALV